MKKRILPVVLAVFLIVGAGGIAAWADDAYKLDLLINPVANGYTYENQNLNARDRISIPLNPDMFLKNDAPDPSAFDLSRLDFVVVTSGGEQFANLFTVNNPQFYRNGQNIYLDLLVTDREYTTNVDFGYYIMLEYNDPVNGVSQANMFRFSGTVAKNKEPAASNGTGPSTTPTSPITDTDSGYQVTGWGPNITVASAYQLAPGGYIQYGVLKTAEVLASTGPGIPEYLNQELIKDYNIAVRTNNSNFGAQLQAVSGGYVVVVHTQSSIPTGNYNVAVELYSTSGTLPGYMVYDQLDIKVERNADTVSGNKIVGINEDSVLGETSNGIWGAAEKNGKTLPNGDEALDNLWIYPGDEIKLYFDSDTFEWENNAPAPPTTALTSSLLRRGDIAVKLLNGKHNNLLETAEIRYNNSQAYVYLKFVEKFISTKDIDFDIEVALTYKKRNIRDTQAYLSGTIGNEFSEVSQGDDYIDLSYGEIVEATDNITKVEVYLGEDVSIITRMIKGKTYYGVATLNDMDSEDSEVFENNPDVVSVYHLATVGLNGDGNNVKIRSGEKFYVYNRYMEYVGTTDEMLPYSTKYYLAAKQLDAEEVIMCGDDGEPENYNYYESAKPGTSTPGPTGGNSNSNPNTGR